MKPHYQYTLTRFGQPYAWWGPSPESVKKEFSAWAKRPWWWLRLLGWNIGFDPEGIPNQ